MMKKTHLRQYQMKTFANGNVLKRYKNIRQGSRPTPAFHLFIAEGVDGPQDESRDQSAEETSPKSLEGEIIGDFFQRKQHAT